MTTQALPIDDAATSWYRPATSAADPAGPLLVLMHGYGADERDLLGLAAGLPPEFLIASIRAPLPGPSGGYAWFPITGDPAAPAPAAADAAAAGVLAWLERLQHPGPVHLLGFSQGGAMATHLLRHAPGAFASAVVLSGFTVPGPVDGDAALTGRRPPVFFGYGDRDPIVPAAAFDRIRAFLAEHARLEERTYPVGHGIDAAELADVAGFLRAQAADQSR